MRNEKIYVIYSKICLFQYLFPLEDQLAAAQVYPYLISFADFALQDSHSERVLQLPLDGALEGPGPVHGVEPLLGQVALDDLGQREMQDPLAMRILQGEFSEGDKVQVDLRGGQLVFEREEVLEKAA